MAGHLVRRLVDLLVTVWGVSTMVFIVLRLSGDPVALFVTERRFSRRALPLVLQTLPATLELTMAALVLATLLAIPLGVLAAVRKNGWVDQLVVVGALFGQSMPFFW